MSDTIYGRLFRAPPPNVKSWTEDFLTESLGDLIGRMPNIQQLSFVELVLLKRLESHEWKSLFLEQIRGRRFVWKTQHRITVTAVGASGSAPEFDGKRPDIVLFVDGRPVLVVEAKVDAPATEEQLEHYRKWLRNEQTNPLTMTVTVLLLRNLSRAPSAMTIDGGRQVYGAQETSVIIWTDLYEWLSQYNKIEDGYKSDWQTLSGEFRKFLEERRVVDRKVQSSPATYEQIQIAHAFFAARGRLSCVADAVGSEICKHLAKLQITGSPEHIELDVKRNTYWSYVKNGKRPYVGWGFCFPSQHETWPELPDCVVGSSYFFLCIESDGRISDELRLISHLPEGWGIVNDETLIKLYLLTPQFPDEGDLSQIITSWAATSIGEIWNIFEHLNRS